MSRFEFNENNHNEEALEIQKKKMVKLMKDPGIRETSDHSLMIDAGSTGSRLRVYEFEPRVLENFQDVKNVRTGKRLTFPGSNDQWTDRIRPGLGTFASIAANDEVFLQQAIYEYLSPMIEFGKTLLRSKSENFGDFPIYLKATAGMRMLPRADRSRVMNAVRNAFRNKTFCPFSFENERARVISGEEEAVYGWAGVNFLMGTLLSPSGHSTPGSSSSSSVGTTTTFGTLDMGGASTQISFVSDGEDFWSNFLCRLQIGTGKRWNVYARSFMYYGVNEAYERFGARLVAAAKGEGKNSSSVHNPCLPGGTSVPFTTNMTINSNGVESWTNSSLMVIMENNNPNGNFTQCTSLTYELLGTGSNGWCEFALRDNCSLSGAANQPRRLLLPTQNAAFGEFLAFSAFYHVWVFLNLPRRATISQLRDRAEDICAMNLENLVEYNSQREDPEEDRVMKQYCFRVSYVYQLLHNGYGFGLNDSITAINVINNHKVDWALGSMLYEINILPWKVGRVNIHPYEQKQHCGRDVFYSHIPFINYFTISIVVCLLLTTTLLQLNRGFRVAEKVKHNCQR